MLKGTIGSQGALHGCNLESSESIVVFYVTLNFNKRGKRHTRTLISKKKRIYSSPTTSVDMNNCFSMSPNTGDVTQPLVDLEFATGCHMVAN